MKKKEIVKKKGIVSTIIQEFLEIAILLAIITSLLYITL